MYLFSDKVWSIKRNQYSYKYSASRLSKKKKILYNKEVQVIRQNRYYILKIVFLRKENHRKSYLRFR